MPEPEDFEEFVRACTFRLFRIGCLLTGGDRARAEDLVSEALARVYLAWPRIRTGDGFGYARRTLVNLHTDWWRVLRRRPEVVTDWVPDVAVGGEYDAQVVRRDGVMRALRGLTRRERAVVVYRYFLDLTEQDTAAELGVSLGTVKSTNARALAKLRVSDDMLDAADARVARLATRTQEHS